MFKETGLKEYLDSKGIDKLTFAGMQAEFCIDVSTKVAFEHGYQLELIGDAITTFDNDYLSAEQILSFYKEFIWDNRFAQVKNTEDILNSSN
nr:isochorismatase family protein [Streptococcus mutans]